MSSVGSTTSQEPDDAAEYNEEYLGAPGVRFVPTDWEHTFHYLRRKLRGEPLPTDLVLDGHDAYAEHPTKFVSKLGGATDGAWYLFSPRDRRHAGGMRPKRDTGDDEGYWKAVELEKRILGGADGKEVIGTKRWLTFYENFYQVDAVGKRKRVRSKSKPTKWRMEEFVSSNTSRAAGDDTAPDPMLLNASVLCKITIRSLRAADKGPAAQGEEEEEENGDDNGEEENDDDNGEEEPMFDGGAESQEKHHLPEQPPEGAQGEQQRPPSGGGAGAQGEQQPETAALPDDDYRGAQYFVGVDGSNRSGTDMLSIFNSGDHIGKAYGGGESLDAKRAGTSNQHRAAVPGHHRTSSSNRRQKLRTGEVMRPRRLPLQLHKQSRLSFVIRENH